MKNQLSKAHVEVYRAIHGAVRNVAHHHQGWITTEYAARSIAKRAAGTLTARWPEVLAAQTQPSDEAGNGNGYRLRHDRRPRPRGASRAVDGVPLRRLWKRLAIMAGEAKRNHDQKRAATLIDVLKLISRELAP